MASTPVATLLTEESVVDASVRLNHLCAALVRSSHQCMDSISVLATDNRRITLGRSVAGQRRVDHHIRSAEVHSLSAIVFAAPTTIAINTWKGWWWKEHEERRVGEHAPRKRQGRWFRPFRHYYDTLPGSIGYMTSV